MLHGVAIGALLAGSGCAGPGSDEETGEDESRMTITSDTTAEAALREALSDRYLVLTSTIELTKADAGWAAYGRYAKLGKPLTVPGAGTYEYAACDLTLRGLPKDSVGVTLDPEKDAYKITGVADTHVSKYDRTTSVAFSLTLSVVAPEAPYELSASCYLPKAEVTRKTLEVHDDAPDLK